MKIFVSISPNESIISVKVEKLCGDNDDNLIPPMLMPCLRLIPLEDF